jgi:4a-hydroxytetrahydrobiopterin dehydratase
MEGTIMPAPLSEAEIVERLAKLPGWEREGDQIAKTFRLANYASGLAFASAVGTIADGFDHHPDIVITWRKVRVSFTTHSAGNKLTQNDFDVAQAIEGLKYHKAAD